MTFREIQRECASHGMSIRRTRYGEYRVAYRGQGNEASAYYTPDLHDAFETAKLMYQVTRRVDI